MQSRSRPTNRTIDRSANDEEMTRARQDRYTICVLGEEGTRSAENSD